MGASLSSVKERMDKGSVTHSKREEAAEALFIIDKLVGTMKQQFFKDSPKNFEFLDIPVVTTVCHYDWEECPTSAAREKIAPALKRRISRISHGSVAVGLYNLAQHAISQVLLEPPGSFQPRTYTILNRDLHNRITRLDIFFFAYRFKSKALRREANPLIACQIVKSTTKVDRINENTLRILVGKCFRHSRPELILSIYQELHDVLIRGRQN